MYSYQFLYKPLHTTNRQCKWNKAILVILFLK